LKSFPSHPNQLSGSALLRAFEKAQRLVVEKRTWAVAHGGARAGLVKLPEDAGRITFSEKMGAHELSVAEVLSEELFVEFVDSYLKDKYQVEEAPIRPQFKQIIQSYVDTGFRWFAFDVIVLDSESTLSREPIEYRFATDRVYYPMRISNLEQGDTEVELLVFTPNGVSEHLGLPAKSMNREPPVDVTSSEVETLDPMWANFYGQEASNLVMDQWSIKGDIRKFTQDVIAR